MVIPDSGNSAFSFSEPRSRQKLPLLKKTRKLDANTQNSEKNLESMRVHRRPTNRRRAVNARCWPPLNIRKFGASTLLITEL